MSYNYLPLDRKWLSFQQVKNLLDYDQLVSITFDSHERILKCREYLDKKSGVFNEDIPGNNTGLNQLQNSKIDNEQIAQWQKNLIVGHACGLGDEVPTEIVRLVLMLKIKSLSYGHSGVQIDTVKRLMEMYNNAVYPVIYTQGSYGAGGDSSLSYLSLPLIGLGEVYYKGQKRKSNEVLQELNWSAVSLQSEEGSALINGTQFTTAYGLYALKKAERLLKFADVIAALSFDVFGCSGESIDDKINSNGLHKGEADTIAAIRQLLTGSERFEHQKFSNQNPYSFNCIPQIHSAAKDTFEYVLRIFLTEINSVTGNPVIFPDEDLLLRQGNFQQQPLALALDFLSIAMAGIGNISEKRVLSLVNAHRDSAFITQGSGFMLPSTAAGIVNENKQLCTPSSISSIVSINGHEDFVSTGSYSATKCLNLIDNIEKLLAIELLTAVQVLELMRPKKTSPMLEEVVAAFSKEVLFGEKDGELPNNIIKAIDFIASYKF